MKLNHKFNGISFDKLLELPEEALFRMQSVVNAQVRKTALRGRRNYAAVSGEVAALREVNQLLVAAHYWKLLHVVGEAARADETNDSFENDFDLSDLDFDDLPELD